MEITGTLIRRAYLRQTFVIDVGDNHDATITRSEIIELIKSGGLPTRQEVSIDYDSYEVDDEVTDDTEQIFVETATGSIKLYDRLEW